MILLIPDGGDSSCDHCGAVYNPFLDRFWSGTYPCTKPESCEGDGDVHEFLCNRCHRELYREPDKW